LQNQVAVVSGGARGIGAGIVRRFVEEGARVVFSDLLDEKGKALEEELGENVAFQRADASSPSETEAHEIRSETLRQAQLCREQRGSEW
jgi:3alpha(or 20beta)-hydroxysteroid dehydrogenase